MCGRFVQTTEGRALQRAFQLPDAPATITSYNVAPTMEVGVIRQRPGVSQREYAQLVWGLIPPWAKDRKIGPRLINARSESVAKKSAFREAFVARRCLVPADGFYEWTTGPGKVKQPYLIRVSNDGPFAMAGLWERWYDEHQRRLESFTILTTRANESIEWLHDRMPVILDAADQLIWLDPHEQDPERLQALLAPFDAARTELVPVSRLVNHVANDDPSLIVPIELPDPSEPPQGDLFG